MGDLLVRSCISWQIFTENSYQWNLPNQFLVLPFNLRLRELASLNYCWWSTIIHHDGNDSKTIKEFPVFEIKIRGLEHHFPFSHYYLLWIKYFNFSLDLFLFMILFKGSPFFSPVDLLPRTNKISTNHCHQHGWFLSRGLNGCLYILIFQKVANRSLA